MVGDADLEYELLQMTDAFTDELFDLPGAERLVFPVSRLLVDPERFERDEDEPMAERGMGAVYTKTHRGDPLKNGPDREALIRAYYRPHHSRFAQAVEDRLARFGKCLIVDAHSFPSQPLPCDLDPMEDRPDICIGTDPFHTPGSLTEFMREAFAARGYTLGVDRPYRGAIVPSVHWRKDARVASIMVELNPRPLPGRGGGAEIGGVCGVQAESAGSPLRTRTSLVRNGSVR